MAEFLVIFPSEWVAYSPTILNLVDLLRDFHQVTVVAIDTNKYDSSHLNKKIYRLIKVPLLLARFLSALGVYELVKCILLYFSVRRVKADVVIGVDSLGAYVGGFVFNQINLLSLEVKRDIFLKKIKRKGLNSVAIQSSLRFEYLLHDHASCPVFILPNSPRSNFGHGTKLSSNKRVKNNGNWRAIFLGNVIPLHGVYFCCDAVKHLNDVVLTIKGPIRQTELREIEKRYSFLLKSGKIILDTDYLPQEYLVDYLSGFDVGFCFYDVSLIKKGDFNYISSPSGKMYAYFSAGVPIIGSNILGLQAVREYDAGLLLDDYDAEFVRQALGELESNYTKYSGGCIRAAEALDFDKFAKPYIDYLIESSDTKKMYSNF